jgi:hypothetical protein
MYGVRLEASSSCLQDLKPPHGTTERIQLTANLVLASTIRQEAAQEEWACRGWYRAEMTCAREEPSGLVWLVRGVAVVG